MHPDQVWGNDEKYSKEFQIAFRKQCEEERKQREEKQKKYEQWKAEYISRLPEEQRPGYLTQQAKIKLARGEIVDPIIKNWLEGEITSARIALAVGMILTVLIKGQIIIWAIMYIAYRCRVNKAKKDALEANRKHYK